MDAISMIFWLRLIQHLWVWPLGKTKMNIVFPFSYPSISTYCVEIEISKMYLNIDE